MWSSHLNKLLAQLNEVDSREPRLERATPPACSHRGSFRFGYSPLFTVDCPYPPSQTAPASVCTPFQQHTRHGDGTSSGGNSEGRSSVSREGKRDPPSLSFITQVSTRPAIFLSLPPSSFVRDLASTGCFVEPGTVQTTPTDRCPLYVTAALACAGGRRRTTADR